ncbi:FAD-binding domain-containing protein [Achromobacter xylosoxidans]
MWPPACCRLAALRAAQAANLGELDSGKAGIATWINELLWREFYQHLLAAYPELSMHRPMKPETAHVPWRDAPEDLLAWQEGRTGIPIVDAAMRQLLALGWMHNRLRMVTAMFLSKNLLIDWRLGEAWFMAHLVDGDLAANNGGWQWSASTGADAVPYFRVFNPLSQSRKFDPDGVFLREWLPELAHLPGDAIHDPSPMERARARLPRAHRGPGRQLAARAGSVRQSAARLNRRASRAGSRVRGAPIPRRRDAPLAAHPKPTITSRRASLRAFTFCIIFKYLDLNQDRPGVRPR